MSSNLEKYKADLDRLINSGNDLFFAMQAEAFPKEFRQQILEIKDNSEVADEFIRKLPSFRGVYQAWYSESKALIRQVLPDRLEDFVRHYERPKSRKEITYANYTIEDHLQGLTITQGYNKEKVVGPDAAIPHFKQQLHIIESVKTRFESSLFDIRQLVQADLFDTELDAAEELARKKFGRAAGALAGVVLEKHLSEVCENHAVKISKKDPSIGDLNDALKNASAIDVPQWRFNQHLADLRNLCAHNKLAEPTSTQVDELILGVRKITKTLF